MRVRHVRPATRLALAVALLGLAACRGSSGPSYAAYPAARADTMGTASGGTPLVLQIDEGERRVRRTAAKGPFILKVDQQNGGSPDLVMGYEELAPGAEIQLHRHLVADEILFVHRGTGAVFLEGRETPVRAGATVYVPRDVTIRLVNTGTDPLGLAFVFSHPGFEALMRENSVREGEPVVPLTATERAAIQARHQWHTIAGARQP
jgi:quercetin dioxygenase-like cupin family protein